jgi:hypothetical protein
MVTKYIDVRIPNEGVISLFNTMNNAALPYNRTNKVVLIPEITPGILLRAIIFISRYSKRLTSINTVFAICCSSVAMLRSAFNKHCEKLFLIYPMFAEALF